MSDRFKAAVTYLTIEMKAAHERANTAMQGGRVEAMHEHDSEAVAYAEAIKLLGIQAREIDRATRLVPVAACHDCGQPITQCDCAVERAIRNPSGRFTGAAMEPL